MKRLSGIEEIAICRFTPEDVLRHTLVEKIIEAYKAPLTEENESGEEEKEDIPGEEKELSETKRQTKPGRKK